MTRPSDEHLAVLVQNAQTVLIDFDGPLCDLFAIVRATDVADSVREFAISRGTDLSVVDTADPLELLRSAYRNSHAFGRDIESRVIEHERDAAISAIPTDGAHAFVQRAKASGRAVVVVSNNSADPIRTYLDHHGMTHSVTDVIGRPFGAPGEMKPSPVLVERALAATGTAPGNALFVGDTITDMMAGGSAHVPCVGYTKGDPDRTSALADSGAAAVVQSVRDLARLVGGS